jgi:hypothetical protein
MQTTQTFCFKIRQNGGPIFHGGRIMNRTDRAPKPEDEA